MEGKTGELAVMGEGEQSKGDALHRQAERRLLIPLRKRFERVLYRLLALCLQARLCVRSIREVSVGHIRGERGTTKGKTNLESLPSSPPAKSTRDV